MPDVQVVIPSPVLQGAQQFQVSISSDGGNTWTFFGDETNAPFVITGLSAGSYELRATLDGCEVIYCFDVVGNQCPCPQNISATLLSLGGLNHVTIQFDLPGGMPTCPITVIITGTNNQISFYLTQNYTQIGQLTHITGDTYSVTFTAPAAPYYDVTVNMGGQFPVGCFHVRLIPNTVGGHCPQHEIIYLAEISGQYFLVVNIGAPTGPYDNPMTIHYTQNNVLGPDIGTKVGTCPNSTPPFNFVFSGALNPTAGYVGDLSYNITLSSPNCKPVAVADVKCYNVGCTLI